MGFLTSVSGFFKRDKSTQIAKQAKGISVVDPNVRFGNGIMAGSDGNSMGMRGLSAALNMDQDLMMRYADMENMDDYPELNCLAGDSIIFTLKDGWITIRELAERGGSFYVLSYDKELKSIVPSLCEGALCTYPEGHSKQMVVVTMDNGQTLKCTADHRFMLKGEKWVKAEDLKLNDRLMPGYLRLRNPGEGQHGYWQLHQPSEASLIRASDGKRWTWVHRLVGELMLGATKGDIVHHKDNTLNNDPDAISIEDLVTHATIHLAPIDNTKYFPAWTTEMRVKMAERMRGNTYSKGRTLSEETRRKMSVVRKGKAKNKEWRERIGNSQPNKINLNRQEVEAAFLEMGTIAGVAKKLGVSWSKAKRYIAKNDIKNEYANHRVLNVRYIDSKEALYDLQVSKYENFVCNGVVVHNSALDIFSDDCTVTDNVRGKTIWTESKDKVIRDIVDDLLHRRLRIEEDVWSIIRSFNKYGNAYSELIIIPGQGVVGLNPLPVATMRRIIDMRGATLGYMQDMTGQFAFHMANVQNIKQLKQALKEREVIFFEPWEVVHWRLSSKHIRSIYGFGILESARWVFKRLVMLEDTMLLYRLSRSPGRFAFYVDTGDLPPAEAMAQVKRVKQSYKKRTLLNPTTGQLEFRNNPMCLAGDTVVRLEDGRLLSILEIVEEYEAGKVNAVYSYDIGTKKRKVMPITWAGKTREHAAMVKVTLENGNSIYCTPDHEFPLYEDGKCKAENLTGKNLVALNLDPEKVFDVCEWGPAEQTYTLTINGTHTFGLYAGVFTCNSPEEDIFIPTRGGKESTRVEILSGPDWSVNDDLEYLRDKLFTSIKIPRAYYGGDADASQSLAQKDVRFARTCLRIQREFRNGIRHIARIHMAALGIDPDSTEWDTRMTAPSSILELQQIETMNSQAGLISALENKLPLDWMLQRIMHLSQDDAATVMLKKDDEIANNAEAQAKLAFDLQKKYPGVDTSQLGEPSALPMGQGQDQGQQQGQAQQGQPSENINKKIDNINLLLKENIQCQRQVVKKIEEMGPIAKLVKRAYRGRNSKNANN
jgi:intein/homing endonuclease